MKLHVYVDGSGMPKSTYGYYVKETGDVKSFKGQALTNNEAELMAFIEVLTDPVIQHADEVTIYSDSKNAVGWLNHDFGINEDRIRNLCLQIWELMKKCKSKPIIKWIERKKNPAGRMLGS